jgi:hypothetical protein
MISTGTLPIWQLSWKNQALSNATPQRSIRAVIDFA